MIRNVCVNFALFAQGMAASKQQRTDNSGFQVDKHSSGNVFPCAGLAEEGVERVVSTSDGFVARHLTVWLDSMFKTVQLPASVAHLDTGLANVNGDAFPLCKTRKTRKIT